MEPAPDEWLRIVLVLWFALVALCLTWAPFDFALQADTSPWANRPSIIEMLGNAVLLLPVGFIIGRSADGRTAVLRALAAGAMLSCALEVGQAFLPGRIVSWLDVLLNTAGSGIGALLFSRIRRRLGPRRPLIMLFAGVYILIVIFVMFGGFVYQQRFQISGWRPDFQIVAGNEYKADRHYQGEVSEVRICGGVIKRVCAAPGADEELRRKLVRAVEDEQVVDVYAEVMSTSDAQTGPTRIATFSDGPYARNITVAQTRTDLVIRIRTWLMGPNGTNIELLVPRAVHAGVRTSLHVGYQQGTVQTELTSNGRTLVAEHRFDALSSGLMLSGLAKVKAEDTRRTRLVMALVLLTGAVIGVLVWFDWKQRVRTD